MPEFVFFNEILPPCCSAIVDTIVRPKPTPSIKFEFGPRLKGSNEN